jgi:hypothetical protein
MSKTINLKSLKPKMPTEEKQFTPQDLIEQIKTKKRTFIPPKQKMKESMDNDSNYLMALGGFIEHAQRELQIKMNNKQYYEASKLQLEIFDAIGKFQANEGIVYDKATHYEKVFLPHYEKELEESREKFSEVYQEMKTIAGWVGLSGEEEKIQGFIKKELDEFDQHEMKLDEEYRNYMYKLFKRLVNKYKEIGAVKVSS